MLYEIHMLKNYPPTNLNRDDTGSPKTCFFGGTQRGRISSQCLKRAWRMSPLFTNLLGEHATRTRRLPDLVGEELLKRGVDEEFVEVAKKKATGLANKDGAENTKGITSQVIIYAPEDIKAVADRFQALIEECKSPKELEKLKAKDIAAKFADVKTRPITLDIALFGRMVTSDAFRNVEAAMQVAHAISTHGVNQESDYYTAVDDLIASGLIEDREDSGAGMLGDIDYNACCYYHYAAIDVEQLKANLEDAPDAAQYVEALLPAFLKIMSFTNPSGKQNTFAGHALPSAICVEIKRDPIPVSYANAYAKAVYPKQEGLIRPSIAQLVEEIDRIDGAFGLQAERLWFAPGVDCMPTRAERYDTLQALSDQAMTIVKRG